MSDKDLKLFDVPETIAQYCRREENIPQPSLWPREAREREKWQGAKTFQTARRNDAAPIPELNNKSSAAQIHEWQKQLEKRDIRVIETCLESADPFLLDVYNRCKCAKCCPNTLNAPPKRERAWFATTATKFSETQGKIDIQIPENLKMRYIAEQEIPQIVPKLVAAPKSFLCFVYDLAECKDKSKVRDFRENLEKWRKVIADAGFKTKETCSESYDPCDLSVDCCCYACREWFGCASYRLWIWKEAGK